MRNAVVCGGMLAVWKFAWVIRTVWPGRSSLKGIGIPFRFWIRVEFVTTYRVWLFKLPGVPV